VTAKCETEEFSRQAAKARRSGVWSIAAWRENLLPVTINKEKKKGSWQRV
jgi:hypothetical protein